MKRGYYFFKNPINFMELRKKHPELFDKNGSLLMPHNTDITIGGNEKEGFEIVYDGPDD